MKKIVTLFCLSVAIALTTSAQITITPASGFAPGDHYSIQAIDADFVEISDEGANVDVDYGVLVKTGTPQSVNYVSPAGTPYASTFPNATVASSTVSTQGTSAYAYYTNTATAFSVIGIGTPQYTMKYSNPSLQINFPMSFGDSVYDESAAQYTVNGVLVKRFSVMVQKADAYGDITTPQGTFPYLRVYAYQYNIDTMYMDGDIIGMSYSETYTYNYMNSDFKAPLFSYSEVYTGSGDSYSAYYNVSPKTGLNEQSLLTSNESIYPNPASRDEITLSFELSRQERVSFQIVDINGKEVKTLEARELTKGANQLKIDIAALPSGFYALLMGAEQSGSKAVKFVVE